MPAASVIANLRRQKLNPPAAAVVAAPTTKAEPPNAAHWRRFKNASLTPAARKALPARG